MIEFFLIFLAVLVILFFIGKVNRSRKLQKQTERASNFVALVNMQAVQTGISGDKELSDMYSIMAQHLRDAVASASAGQLLYPFTTHKQVQILVHILEEPSLFLRLMAGQGEIEAAETHMALKETLARIVQLSQRG